jgi:hypothetical protein
METSRSRLPLRLWLIFAITVLIFLSGCGSGLPDPPADNRRSAEDDQFKPSKVQPPPPPSPKTAASPAPAGNQDDDQYHPPAQPIQAKPNPVVSTSDDDDSGQRHAQSPSLPAVLSQWKDADFLLARAKNDPRLTQAVEQLAKHPRSTPEEAEMLLSLLRPQTQDTSDHPAQPARIALVRAATAALAASNTDAAKKALCELFAKGLSAAERKAAAEIALAALVRDESPASQQTALKLLTESASASLPAPESAQEEQRTGAGAQKMTAIIRANASAAFRKLLAGALLEPAHSASFGKQFLPVLCESDPLNLDAQVLIYQSRQTDAATRAVLEKQFVAASREALGAFLGFQADQPAKTPLPPDWQYKVGALLWCPPLTEFLNLQHQALRSLAERPASVALAAAIPSGAMRANFERTLSRHWSEGPQAFHAIDAAEKGPVEPGFLIVLKSLARENRTKSSQQQRPGRLVKQSADAEQDSGEDPRPGSESEWIKLAEDLVRDYCRRCHLAALARAAAAFNGGGASPEPRPADSPIPLYPNSTIASAFRFDWPGDSAARLPQLADDVLQVSYTRIEKRVKPTTIVAYYRRQVKSCIERPLADGLWLDGLNELKKEDRLRSIDVLITRAKSGSPQPANEDQELTIEILCVEVSESHE